jgi:hypothetical protein
VERHRDALAVCQDLRHDRWRNYLHAVIS